MIAMLMLGTLGLSTMACLDNNKRKAVEKDLAENKLKITIDGGTGKQGVVEHVLFKKGKLIEVAFLSVKEGMGKQLKEEYFPQVMPIVTEYGGKPLMKVGVKNNYSDEIKAQMVVFFEWPSIAKKEAFNKDPRFLEVKKIRDEALSFLKVGYFAVEEDSPVLLDGNKFYEVYGMSMKKETGHLMQKYFELAGPIVVNDYGVEFALALKPVAVAGRDHFEPHTFGLAIWPSAESNAKFFGSSEYAEIKHYKEDALERIDVWQGAVILEK